MVHPGTNPLLPVIGSYDPGGGVRSIVPQAESSKSAAAHPRSSPVRNFHGPFNANVACPRVMCASGVAGDADAAGMIAEPPGAACALIGKAINGHISSVSQIVRIGGHFTNISQASFWQRRNGPWPFAWLIRHAASGGDVLLRFRDIRTFRRSLLPPHPAFCAEISTRVLSSR